MNFLERIFINLRLNFDQNEDKYIIGLSNSRLIDQAKQDWIDAENIFNEAIDERLVDYAIYEMEAAERKFMHLINQEKNKCQEVK